MLVTRRFKGPAPHAESTLTRAVELGISPSPGMTLELEGCEPYEEDAWIGRRVAIGWLDTKNRPLNTSLGPRAEACRFALWTMQND